MLLVLVLSTVITIADETVSIEIEMETNADFSVIEEGRTSKAIVRHSGTSRAATTSGQIAETIPIPSIPIPIAGSTTRCQN